MSEMERQWRNPSKIETINPENLTALPKQIDAVLLCPWLVLLEISFAFTNDISEYDA